ncbi:MAG: carboxypeptidase Taq [Planctomycetota bacterium]|jgi:carboxypeptidase Taq
MSKTSPFTNLHEELHETATLNSVQGLVSWDQSTKMPKGGGEAKAEQLSLLAGLLHTRQTSQKLGDLISACEASSDLLEDEATAANLRETRRDFDKATKLPADLVRELAKAGSQSQAAWQAARKENNFSGFQPHLEKLLDLTRQKAECLGAPAGGELFDALLDEFEPGSRSSELEVTFEPLRARLSKLILEVAENGTPPDESPLRVHIDEARQHEFGLFVLNAMGFDLESGRLDTTTHPFCTGLAAGDTRLTTRYHEEHFSQSLYGTMHEGGHGIYEQGLPKAKFFGLPASSAVSLGIHESQSRLWENLVGRSREFWVWAMPHAKRILGDALAAYTAEDMYRAVNTAQPSFIRVEADEATYNLHVMVRFEIERAMFTGNLQPADLPSAWNEKFKEYLGVDVPDDTNGCLQDVHWSFGLFGYFPTYCLGNLYASQLWETAAEQLDDLPGSIERGDFAPLKNWLNEKVHNHGRRYQASDLCKRITGKPLSADPMMRHLEGKIRPIYGL